MRTGLRRGDPRAARTADRVSSRRSGRREDRRMVLEPLRHTTARELHHGVLPALDAKAPRPADSRGYVAVACASLPMSARSSWSTQSRRIGQRRALRRAGTARRPVNCRLSGLSPQSAGGGGWCYATSSGPSMWAKWRRKSENGRFGGASVFPAGGLDFRQPRGNQALRHFHISTISPYGGITYAERRRPVRP